MNDFSFLKRSLFNWRQFNRRWFSGKHGESASPKIRCLCLQFGQCRFPPHIPSCFLKFMANLPGVKLLLCIERKLLFSSPSFHLSLIFIFCLLSCNSHLTCLHTVLATELSNLQIIPVSKSSILLVFFSALFWKILCTCTQLGNGIGGIMNRTGTPRIFLAVTGRNKLCGHSRRESGFSGGVGGVSFL